MNSIENKYYREVKELRSELINIINDPYRIEDADRVNELLSDLYDLGYIDTANYLIDQYKEKLAAKEAVNANCPDLNNINIEELIEEYNELVVKHDEIMDFVFFNPEPSYDIQKEVGAALQAVKQRMNEIDIIVKMYNESNK